jgi:hypothetical protein
MTECIWPRSDWSEAVSLRIWLSIESPGGCAMEGKARSMETLLSNESWEGSSCHCVV